MGSYSKKLCAQYGFTASVSFAYKAALRKHPGLVMSMTTAGSVLILAVLLKICEWPYGYASGLCDWNGLFTSIWCIVITMTTVGYGDVYAHTFPGRLISIFTAIWGTFLVSVLILSVGDIFELTEKEVKSISHLRQTRAAANCITASMRYFLAKKKYLKVTSALLPLKNKQAELMNSDPRHSIHKTIKLHDLDPVIEDKVEL